MRISDLRLHEKEVRLVRVDPVLLISIMVLPCKMIELISISFPIDAPGASVPPFCTVTGPWMVPFPISEALLRIIRPTAKKL